MNARKFVFQAERRLLAATTAEKFNEIYADVLREISQFGGEFRDEIIDALPDRFASQPQPTL